MGRRKAPRVSRYGSAEHEHPIFSPACFRSNGAVSRCETVVETGDSEYPSGWQSCLDDKSDTGPVVVEIALYGLVRIRVGSVAVPFSSGTGPLRDFYICRPYR